MPGVSTDTIKRLIETSEKGLVQIERSSVGQKGSNGTKVQYCITAIEVS